MSWLNYYVFTEKLESTGMFNWKTELNFIYCITSITLANTLDSDQADILSKRFDIISVPEIIF